MQRTPLLLMQSVERLRELESGNARLKPLLVDAMLDNEALIGRATRGSCARARRGKTAGVAAAIRVAR